MNLMINWLYEERKCTMKITLLLAQCTSKPLKSSLDVMLKVLKELDVEVHKVELSRLPYFDGKRNKEMEKIVQAIADSKGVIAMSMIPMLGMHGAMQSFFDTATLYEEHYFNKPLMAITYSEWLGEQEAAHMMLRCWSILGGMDGGKLFLNKHTDIHQLQQRLERDLEDFYRLVKQERNNVKSSEHLIFYKMKQGELAKESGEKEGKGEIKSFAELIRQEGYKGPEVTSDITDVKKQVQERSEPVINLSTKEQTIKEIASLLQKEVSEDGFKAFNTGIYTRVPQFSVSNINNKRLQQIPHYFIAQYDKELELVLKYHINDLNEEGYIVIKDGDCFFKEEVETSSTVEMILSEEILQSILTKKITYQKAFMLGKLKVRGNFAVLPKLDQVFKAL